jgi:hypothetical protein
MGPFLAARRNTALVQGVGDGVDPSILPLAGFFFWGSGALYTLVAPLLDLQPQGAKGRRKTGEVSAVMRRGSASDRGHRRLLHVEADGSRG